jgi:ribosomal protein L20A (L18A)
MNRESWTLKIKKYGNLSFSEEFRGNHISNNKIIQKLYSQFNLDDQFVRYRLNIKAFKQMQNENYNKVRIKKFAKNKI